MGTRVKLGESIILCVKPQESVLLIHHQLVTWIQLEPNIFQ